MPPVATTRIRQPLPDEAQATAWMVEQLHRLYTKEVNVPTMPLQYITAFLMVARAEGKSVTEYAEIAGVSTSVMSRHLLDIGDRSRTHEPGYGLVTSRPNPTELRRHEIFLTPKGRALAMRFHDHVENFCKRRGG
jgi:DNA-binding MarR family transcriptional regulator